MPKFLEIFFFDYALFRGFFPFCEDFFHRKRLILSNSRQDDIDKDACYFSLKLKMKAKK